MRVLHVVTDTDRRGAQVFASDLDRALAARGNDSCLLALAPGSIGGLAADVCGSTRRGWATWHGLARHAREYDVVIGHGSATLAALAFVRASGLCRTPFVYRQISDPAFWWAGARRWRVRAYLTTAAHVVALAPSTRDAVCHMGVGARRVTVIPNGVDPAQFPLAGADARATARDGFGLTPHARVVGYAGALVAEKGVDALIDAIATLPDTLLLVAGDGPCRAELEALARRVAPDRVVFTGSLAALHDFYAAIDVLALASRAGDSMPAVIIEANLSGRPVVATPVGAITEMIEPGLNGALVAVGDAAALAAALADQLSGRRVDADAGIRAFARSRYDLSTVAEQWEAVLCDVVASRAGAGRPAVAERLG